MSDPVAGVQCLMGDPCLQCSTGMGHPPMLAVYDSAEGQYVLEAPDEEDEEICIGRHYRDGISYAAGEVCGRRAVRWVADIPLCMTHYKRLINWIATEDEITAERDARSHEQRMRQQEELSQQAARLRLERAAAEAEAMAAHSVVYYIRRVSDGMVKIGFSASPRSRLNSHRREHGPIEVLLVLGGGRDEENEAHGKFHEYQIGRTEWFRPVRPLFEWICWARENHTHPRVQPEDVLPVEEIRALAEAAPPAEALHWDDDGTLFWPPDMAVA